MEGDLAEAWVAESLAALGAAHGIEPADRRLAMVSFLWDDLGDNLLCAWGIDGALAIDERETD